jgi:hypothetical protein
MRTKHTNSFKSLKLIVAYLDFTETIIVPPISTSSSPLLSKTVGLVGVERSSRMATPSKFDGSLKADREDVSETSGFDVEAIEDPDIRARFMFVFPI